MTTARAARLVVLIALVVVGALAVTAGLLSLLGIGPR